MVSRRVAAAVVVTLVVAAAAGVAVAMDEAESRQSDRNSTIAETIDAIVDETVNEIEAELGLIEESLPVASPTASIGNILYSTMGFVLGGLLLFVSLFDVTRKPVIEFFDNIFGGRHVRRRREASTGLEAQVAAAFHTFTSAVDKMDAILRLANNM